MAELLLNHIVPPAADRKLLMCCTEERQGKWECAPKKPNGRHHKLLHVSTQEILGFRKRWSASLSMYHILDVISDCGTPSRNKPTPKLPQRNQTSLNAHQVCLGCDSPPKLREGTGLTSGPVRAGWAPISICMSYFEQKQAKRYVSNLLSSQPAFKCSVPRVQLLSKY